MRTLWPLLYMFAALSFQAQATDRTYVIHGNEVTLYQVARDTYQDQRRWRDIACRNHLRPPYSLHDGQVLILPESELEAESSQGGCGFSSVARDLREENGVLVYTVNDRAPSLSAIARELYGDRRRASEIMQWNNLKADAQLHPGQRLVLQLKPPTSSTEGDQILIAYWSRLGNLTMASRLTSSPVRVQSKTAGPPKVLAKPRIQKTAVMVAPPKSTLVAPVPSAKGPASVQSAAQTTIAVPVGAQPVITDGHEREPASIEEKLTGERRKSQGYWLGEEADRIIKVLSDKLKPQK